MNLESEGEWDEYWVVSCFFFLFYSFHFIKQVFTYLYMYKYVHKYV